MGDMVDNFALIGIISVMLAGGCIAVRSAGQGSYKWRLKEAAKTSAITFTIWAFALPAVSLYFGLGQFISGLPALLEKPAEVKESEDLPPPGFEGLLKDSPSKDSVGRKTHNPFDEYLDSADKKKD